jgi:hypothetical protein
MAKICLIHQIKLKFQKNNQNNIHDYSEVFKSASLENGKILSHTINQWPSTWGLNDSLGEVLLITFKRLGKI